MTDIVERLKNDCPCSGDIGCADALCQEAAEEIKRLREALADNDLYVKTWSDNYDAAQEEITRLRAENERMRKALTKIALHYDRIYYPGELSFEFAEIARAALKGDSDE